MLNVYQARHKGREYCNNWEGSEHYKEGGIEPLDLAISMGSIEDFSLISIIKYAKRFKKTRNLADLRKIADYAHIVCGVELDKAEQREIEVCTPTIESDPKEATFHT